MVSRLVTTEERRARLGRRHTLATSGGKLETVVDDLVVLHATDPATIFLSLSARVHGISVADVEDALYERRSMARTLAMRRTLYVATTTLIGQVERSSAVGVGATERKRLEQYLADSAISSPDRWLAAAFAEVATTLQGTNGLAARAITAAVPVLGTKITMGAGTKHEASVGATSRVLGLMAVEGEIVRGRPNGDWTGRQYVWHRRDDWWPGDAYRQGDVSEEEASASLLRHWLARFGPATVDDMKWWTGWTMTKTRAVLRAIDTAEVVLDGTLADTVGHVLADDLDPVTAGPPWARLLPALDPTAMGWKHRDWYLGPHKHELFDRNGNIGPTVWVDGRIVGGWSQAPDGEVLVELLEPVGADHRAIIEADCQRVADFVGDTVVRPSFPTPLQKRLSAS